MRTQRVPALVVAALLAVLGFLGGMPPAVQAVAAGAAAPAASSPDAAAASHHTARAVRSDGVRTRHDAPRRTTAEDAHGARPLLLPPAPGGLLSDAPASGPAVHGRVRVTGAREGVRTPARAELPDVRGPPGTAGHRSRPTSPPARPS
ncbi:hypothetical protein QRN89_02800 [Streptomyces chengbuensis]|uniref:hypothetical protein n=1 Tax=Streptomyces chengbuensis TaxID=3053466 RepID=UPI0025B4E58F|nr:hypothetical protein [Streptomyces sp. HUAS CB01]WJY48824.1 hypothetical protein QRN89_02800 [Streptomyces sp. HUAS CB01]